MTFSTTTFKLVLTGQIFGGPMYIVSLDIVQVNQIGIDCISPKWISKTKAHLIQGKRANNDRRLLNKVSNNNIRGRTGT